MFRTRTRWEERRTDYAPDAIFGTYLFACEHGSEGDKGRLEDIR